MVRRALRQLACVCTLTEMCLAAEHPSDENLELSARERLEASKATCMSFHLESCAECRDRLAQAVIYLLDLRQHMKGTTPNE